MIPTLRPYQQKLVDDIREAFARHRRVLAVSPTGSGKTVTFSYITASVQEKRKRVILVAHRAEIIDQISAALLRFGVQHGVIAPGRPRTDAPVQVGMVQTVARRLGSVTEPDLLVVDEAHHAVAGTYQEVMRAWQKCRVLGVTATPNRPDGVGLGRAFDAMVLGPTTAQLIALGHLARIVHFAPHTDIDLSGVKIRGGDYEAAGVTTQLMRREIVGDVIDHYRRYLDGAPSIAFLPTVASAERVSEWFRESGLRSTSVDGSLDAGDRSRRVRGLADGSVQVLTSCDLISEGFDVPAVAGALLLRPTLSEPLYLQQCGRALRPKPDGRSAILLDHVGNVHRHGTVDAERTWSLGFREKKTSSVVTCNMCHRVFAKGAARETAREECEEAEGDCPLLEPASQGGVKSLAPVVDGELVAVGSAPAPAPFDATVQGLRDAPLRLLLARAKTREDVAAIARARGYKPGWVDHIMRHRAEKAA